MPDPEAMTPDALEVALGYRRNFARLTARDGLHAEFAYDLDARRWPWLALPPSHPVVLDKVQYFTAVTGSLAADAMEPGTRSALTRIRWSCPPHTDSAGHATRGVLEPWAGDERVGYRLALFGADDRAGAQVTGEGFAFADRDFSAWRAGAKRKAAAQADETVAEMPDTADPVAAGLGPKGRCLVSHPVERDGARAVIALVGVANGFHPAHPFHTGSGDHVNAAHLFDCALQAVHLFAGAGPLACHAGEAEFLRFVELDVPFELRLVSREPLADGGERWRLGVRQSGRENNRIAFDVEPRAPGSS